MLLFNTIYVFFFNPSSQLVRNKTRTIGSFARTIILTILIGFTFFRMNTDQESIQSRTGLLVFWPTQMMFITIMPIILVFPLERNILMRERAARAYRVSSFYLSKAVAEGAYAILFNTMSLVPLYFMVGFQLSVSKFFLWLAIQLSFLMVAVCVALCIRASARTPQAGQIIGPLSCVFFLLFAGFLVNNNQLPNYFAWIQWFSPINYAYRANMLNEMADLSLSCNTKQPCYTTGQQVIDYQNVGGIQIWTCVLANLCIALGFLSLGFLSLKRNSKPNFKLI